jgi:hypothetical protein
MRLDALRQALRRQPFQPFSVRMADGRTLPISHPEFVALGSGVAIVVAEDDSWSVLEPGLIASLEFPGEKGKGGNGSTRKRRRP